MTEGPLAFISSVGTNRLGSADESAERLSTFISDTILPPSVTVTLAGKDVTVKLLGVGVIVSEVAAGLANAL